MVKGEFEKMRLWPNREGGGRRRVAAATAAANGPLTGRADGEGGGLKLHTERWRR